MTDTLRELIAKLLGSLDYGCTSGGVYRLCTPYCENPEQVADAILSLISSSTPDLEDCKLTLRNALRDNTSESELSFPRICALVSTTITPIIQAQLGQVIKIVRNASVNKQNSQAQEYLDGYEAGQDDLKDAIVADLRRT